MKKLDIEKFIEDMIRFSTPEEAKCLEKYRLEGKELLIKLQDKVESGTKKVEQFSVADLKKLVEALKFGNYECKPQKNIVITSICDVGSDETKEGK